MNNKSIMLINQRNTIMKMLFDVDTIGDVTLNGMSVGAIPPHEIVEHKGAKADLETIKELKSAGFDVNEILSMKRENLF